MNDPAAGPTVALRARDLDAARAHALARLAASRQKLQATWVPTLGGAARSPGGYRVDRLAVLWRRWRRRLDVEPALGLLLDAAEDWWQHNPWRLAGQAVATEVDGVLTPWLRRHPWLAVALAAGTGYAIVSLRPWAWPGLRQQLGQLPAHARRWLLGQLARVPLRSLVESLVEGLAVARSRSDAAARTDPSDRAGPSAPAPGPVGIV